MLWGRKMPHCRTNGGKMMVQKLGASLGDPGYSLRSSFGEGSDLNFLIKKQAARVKTKATKKAGMND